MRDYEFTYENVSTFALHLKAVSYNLKRLVFLKEGGLAPF